ncbi:hypothetical protein E2562_008695 [Oryza meyeriana var. granulata]|uniref:Uncharacterized protein n=1 Tax=Oryza meyeriana var. granulata TaxID=110450 RepID=A0A6G1F5L8_9ORYZ|nr:hypothetical protein E2562_008695 [Oryza meyeriana var. granulata]
MHRLIAIQEGNSERKTTEQPIQIQPPLTSSMQISNHSVSFPCNMTGRTSSCCFLARICPQNEQRRELLTIKLTEMDTAFQNPAVRNPHVAQTPEIPETINPLSSIKPPPESRQQSSPRAHLAGRPATTATPPAPSSRVNPTTPRPNHDANQLVRGNQTNRKH